MHSCWFCGSKVIWQNDFDGEDMGYENVSLATILSCSGCGAMWEGLQFKEEEEIGDEKTEEHNTSNWDGD